MHKINKLIWLADDPRIFSGVGGVSRNLMHGMMKPPHSMEIVALGGALNHPDTSITIDYGIKVIPCSGYGDPYLYRNVIASEKPDAFAFMTDPRQFVPLFMIENEIRTKMPMMYYHVWDNPPRPRYNDDYYKSCDYIGCISKVTLDIAQSCKDEYKLDYQYVNYVPHGVDHNKFKPLSGDEVATVRSELTKHWGDDTEFVVLWNSRNIRRKIPMDIMNAFDRFNKRHKKTVLIMHCRELVFQEGTDLPRVKNDLFPDANIAFSINAYDVDGMNKLYNAVDCTINVSHHEGFGLSSLESLATGTPVISTMTGGLTDQISFIEDNKTQYCGIPITAACRSIVGSPPTPYIYQDNVSSEQIEDALEEMYEAKMHDQQKYQGWCDNARHNVVSNFTLKHMVEPWMEGVKYLEENWKPRSRVFTFTE